MDDINPIISEFLTESYENLDQLDQDLVDLEAHPEENDLLASIFRTIHTIKGTCGFLGFTKLESIAHVGESLLSKLRDGELGMTQDIANSLLTMVDAVREILSNIEADRSEGNINYSDLVELMTYLQSGGNPESQEEEQTEGAADRPMEKPQVDESQMFIEEPADPVLSETLFKRLGGQKAVDAAVDIFYDEVLMDDRIKHFFDDVDTERLRNKMKAFLSFAFGGESKYPGITLKEAHQAAVNKGLSKEHFEVFMEIFGKTLQELNIPENLIEEALIIVLSTRDEVLGKAQMEIGKPIEPALPGPTTDYSEMDEADNQGEDRRGGDKDKEEAYLTQNDDRRAGGDRRVDSIRVNVHLLDRLMNLVGELVLARNQIVQFSASERDPTFISSTQHLNQLTAELQEAVMKTRMQPIGNIWNKLPRVVRDLAKSCKKRVRLDMEGKDTELDKTLIEAIKDPLTHIVRNSVDHGIEMPKERAAKGKNPEGRLFLRAYHEGGQVNIEISDDGNGIDPEKIKAKAISKNLITQQDAAAMTDREITDLIFQPGFTTAETVSNLSGRGVGMDVVKTNIEKIGGTVDIHSRVGEGTILKVKIPLTLAIIPALLVTCGGLRYAIPQVSLVELIRLEAEGGVSAIEHIQDSPVYRLRGNLLPLVNLNEALGIESQAPPDSVNIVVLQADNRQFGLVVDTISDTEEIVVKPLGKQLKGITAYAGATIMGDGKVALILDSMGLAQKAHVIAEGGREYSVKETEEQKDAQSADRQTLLVFTLGTDSRMAVPLSMVARLEEFDPKMVERSGDKSVVQYRGDIMPLIFLSEIFGISSTREESDSMQAIVYADRGRYVGVVVDKIIDIVEETVIVKKGSIGTGLLGTALLGSAVVQGKVTDMLDVEGVIRQADPDFYENSLVAASDNQEINDG